MALDERADEALMAAYGRGEVAAFEVLLQRHQRPIYNFLLRSVNNPATAEDLVQEVFMRVIKGAAGYKQQAKFTTWLYTIARNLCVDFARRAKHRRVASLDQPVGRGDDGPGPTRGDLTADRGPNVERQVVSHRLQDRIQQAIGQLSDEQREVFLMRETLNLPFKEIAKIVQCPENTVKSRMRYALEQLRQSLDEYKDIARAAR